MTLRLRVALSAALAVLLAVLLVAAVAFVSTRRQLAQDLDAGLLRTAQEVVRLAPRDLPADAGRIRDQPGGPGSVRSRLLDRVEGSSAPGERAVERLLRPGGGGTVQLVGPGGGAVQLGELALPVDAVTVALATPARREAGEPVPYVREVVAGGQDLRVLALPLDGPGAVQVAAPRDRDAPALAVLRRQLVVAGLLGAVLAAGLGLVVADRAVRPVQRLTDAAVRVRRTGDLATRIAPDEVASAEHDELGRLAAAFNAMLGALEGARDAQQRLVADASHELRTPVTSLRTNLEVLRDDGERLDDGDRRALLHDVTAQLDELGRLVDGLVEVARGERPAQAPTPVVLGDLVEDVVERVAVFAPDVAFTVERDDVPVAAEHDRLERAVANLLDNAVKHGGGTPVEVRVAGGEVVVRDHGPGIAAADHERVFERFYRAPAARALPGSGLGLAIVAQVARAHGGEVVAADHPQGGAVLALRLPPLAEDAAR